MIDPRDEELDVTTEEFDPFWDKMLDDIDIVDAGDLC